MAKKLRSQPLSSEENEILSETLTRQKYRKKMFAVMHGEQFVSTLSFWKLVIISYMVL